MELKWLTSWSYSKKTWKLRSLLRTGWEESRWRKTSCEDTVFLKTARYSLQYKAQGSAQLTAKFHSRDTTVLSYSYTQYLNWTQAAWCNSVSSYVMRQLSFWNLWNSHGRGRDITRVDGHVCEAPTHVHTTHNNAFSKPWRAFNFAAMYTGRSLTKLGTVRNYKVALSQPTHSTLNIKKPSLVLCPQSCPGRPDRSVSPGLAHLGLWQHIGKNCWNGPRWIGEGQEEGAGG